MKRKIKVDNLKKIKAALLLSLLVANNKTEATTINQNEIQIENYGNAKYAPRIYDMMNNLDEGVKQDLIEKECTIVLLEGESDADRLYLEDDGATLSSSILGFTDPPYFNGTNYVGTKIYVEACPHEGYYEKYSEASKGLSKDEFNYRIAANTTIHEVGHVIDYIGNSKLSDTDEFYQIFLNEQENFMKTEEFIVNNFGIMANINTPLEYFAESFAAYYMTKEDLQTYCPETYEYLRNHIEELNIKYGYESSHKK